MRSAKQFLFGSLGAALAVSGLVALEAAPASAAVSTKIDSFPYTQDWSGLTATSSWGDFTGVEGFLAGNTIAAQNLPNSTDVGTLLAEGTLASSFVASASAIPNANNTAGVFAYHAATDKTVALSATGAQATPHLVFHLDTTGESGIGVAYDVQDLDSSADDQPTRVALQYRVGTTGSYVNVPAGYLTDATAGPSNATVTATHVSATLPAAADDKADVFVRVITLDNASGSNEQIGIDNISITTGGVVVPDPLAATNPGNKTFTQNQAIAPLQLQATGGTSPYTWAVTTGTLPNGLSLSADGILSGTPDTVTGSPVSITVTATDSATPTPATATATFTITVQAPLPITPIAQLQGTGARSPYAPATGNDPGEETVTTTGIVTGIYRDPSFANNGFDGFYLQTGGTGGSSPTEGSHAIFVYGASAIPSDLEVGDSVQATGKISEFFGLTELNAPTGGVVELGTALPGVTALATAYPTTEEGREAIEGMLLDPTDDFTVTNAYSTNQYGEVGLASGDEPLRQPTEHASPGDTAAIQAIRDENAERAVVLDDGTSVNYLGNQTTKAQPVPWLTGADGNANPAPPRVGAGVTFHQPVILDYRNNAWKFQPRMPVFKNGADVATFEDTRAADAAPADVLTMTPGRTGDLKIATFNVLNYFNTTGEAYAAAGPLQNPPLDTFCTYYTDRGPGTSQRIGNDSCGVRLLDDPTTPDKDESKDNDGRGPRGAATAASLARQEAKLVHTINALGADVIGLEEVENSIKLPGETNRDDAVARLVDILNAAPGADTWAYVKSPGEALTAAAVAEQDVIRPAFIYKVAKVEPVGGSYILFGTTEFANAREPLAQVFKAKGAPDSDGFAVIVNHFKSKGDNQAPIPPATGDNAQNGEVGAFNGDRIRQATRLVQFADDFAAERDVEAVFLAGDFNSYTGEDPIKVLTGADYTLVESNDEGDESYSYQGLSGSLDHVLGNQAAMDMVTGADIWEINANEAASFQYSRYNYNVTDFWLPNQPWATSDHNPEIVGLDVPDFTPTSYKEIQVIGTNDFHGRLLPDAGNAAGAAPFATAVKDLEGQFPPGATAFVAAGDLVGASTFESFIQDDEPTIDALNAMGLDVSAAGNHEFDRGYTDLADRIRGLADWEYIAANLDYAPDVAESDKLAETWTTTLDGVEVGFVGAVTEDLPGLVNPEGIEDITVTDVVDATNAAADALKTAGAEIVILLVHEGAPTTDCSSASFTDPATVWGNIVQNTSADVDAIISGHTHLAYNCRYPVPDWQADSSRAVKKRPVVSAGQYGTNLNQLVFKFDESSGDLKAIGQDVIAAAGVGYAPDPTVQAIVDDAVDYAASEGATILGKMTGPFKRATYTSSAGATENRGGESTLSNQIAEVQRWATDAAGIETDIAFMNPGGLRADMDGTDTGADVNLSFREAADVQPFANTLVNMKLTGAQLEEILEQQWQRTATGSVPSRPFLRLGVSQGFTYTYDETPVTVTAPNSAPVQTFQGEVTGMWLDGEPVDAARVYSVTVNSFLGGGGDNFWEFADGAQKVDTGKVDLEAMVDYMKQYATDALPVDYSQRGVEITLPDDAPASYGPGDTVEFEVGSWTMSAPGDKHDSELEVRLNGTVLGTFAVDNTVGNQPYDRYGTSSVSVILPEDVFNGATELTVSGAMTGTSIPVVVQVAGGQEPTETPVVNQAPPSVSGAARIGQTLTASTGTWQPEPTSVAYQWYADGAPIPGATGRTLVLGSGQVGTRITVGVTARAVGHTDATAISAAVGPVAKGSATVAVKTKPKKIKLRKTKAKVVVTVTTPDGVAVTGSVTIKAKGQKARTVAIVNGKAKVRLKAFTSTGAKRIKVNYAGSALLAPAKSVTTVWVVR